MRKPTNTLAPQAQQRQTFEVAIQGNLMQSLIAKSTPNEQAAKRLTGDLLSIVNASDQLKKCEPMTVLAAALRGAGMGLILGEEYYVVPYGNSATYILGYKGLLALLDATDLAEDYDCVPVLDGEFKGTDSRTRRPIIDLTTYADENGVLADGVMDAHPVVGYYFWVDLRNGRRVSEYMSIPELLKHAERYSKSFKKADYDKLMSGELSPQETEALMQKSPWYSSTETMMKKTVIRKLLRSGRIRLANCVTMNEAMAHERDLDNGVLPKLAINQETGEVTETPGEVIEGTATVVEDAPTEPEAQESGAAANGDDETPVEGVNDAAPAEGDFKDSFFS